MSIPKEYKLLVKIENRNEKFQILSDFKTKVLQRVRFQNKIFTLHQIFN